MRYGPYAAIGVLAGFGAVSGNKAWFLWAGGAAILYSAWLFAESFRKRRPR